MSRTGRRLRRQGRLRDADVNNQAQAAAPISGRVTGTDPDGRAVVLVRGEDCKSRGSIQSVAPGDDATFSRAARVEGPAAAPLGEDFGTGPGLLPEVVSVDPDVWPADGTTVAVCAGYNLDTVAAVALRDGDPFLDQAFPGVTVTAFEPLTATTLEITVDVDPFDPLPDERGGIAVDDEPRDEPRRQTDELFQIGEAVTPAITSMDVVWPETAANPGQGSTWVIYAQGLNLAGIDTVELDHPGDYADVAVLSSTPTSLELEITAGDNFSKSKIGAPFTVTDSARPWITTPRDVFFGAGVADRTATGIWTAHPPVQDVTGWLFHARPAFARESGGEPIPAGMYALPMPFDPAIGNPSGESLPGTTPLSGRVYALPGTLPAIYSPSATATAQGYEGRLIAEWYGGPKGRLLIAQRGDAIPDGGTGTGSPWGVGNGIWWAVWDVLDGVLHTPVEFPSENRMIGPMIQGGLTVHALTYLSGSGTQVASADIDGTGLAVSSRIAGAVPHEALRYELNKLTASTWNPGGLGQPPPSAQVWNVDAGSRSTVTYNTADRLTSNWTQENRGTAALPGSLIRAAIEFGNVRLYQITGDNPVNDGDRWPNVNFLTLSNRTEIVSSGLPVGNIASGGVIGASPAGGRVLLGQIGSNDEVLAREFDDQTGGTDLVIHAQFIMGDANEPPVATAIFPAGILP